ncbi:hypothetical protein NC651_036220 [Populus alba x Populus x berolinensis]|nr:hypothetical protein NC651_036220 [Populus alba x Populus x berolinensis]
MLGLELPEEPSLQSLRAEEGGDYVEGLFFCMSLFLHLEETLAPHDGPAKTIFVLGGMKAEEEDMRPSPTHVARLDLANDQPSSAHECIILYTCMNNVKELRRAANIPSFENTKMMVVLCFLLHRVLCFRSPEDADVFGKSACIMMVRDASRDTHPMGW